MSDRLRATAVCPLLLFACFVGCEDMPRMPFVANSAVQPNSAVQTTNAEEPTIEGRNYDWNYTSGFFDVSRPTSFEFARKVSTEKVMQRLSEESASLRQGPYLRPEGLEDNQYILLQRYIEPPPPIKFVPLSTKEAVKSVAMDRLGKRVVLIGQKLSVWDPETGQLISSMELPSVGIKQASFSLDEKSMYMRDDQTVIRFELESGKVLCKWKPDSGTILAQAVARDVDELAVMTSQGRVTLLSADLQFKGQTGLANAIPRSLAIHPKGAHVLVASEESLVRWVIKPDDKGPAKIPTADLKMRNTLSAAGTKIDRFISQHNEYDLNSTFNDLSPTEVVTPQLLNSVVEFAHASSVDGTQDWLTIICKKPNKNGDLSYIIQDLAISEYRGSTPQELPYSNISQVAFSYNSDRFVVVADQGVVCIERRRWIDSSGLSILAWAEELFRRRNFEQLELFANEIRNFPVRRAATSGPEMFDGIATQIGSIWSELEASKDSIQGREEIQAWYDAGSELALLSSASRHSKTAYSARGKGLANTVSANAWQIQEEQTVLMKADLDKLFKKYEPSPGAYTDSIDLINKGLDVRHRLDEWIKESIERWPNSVFPITSVLLPLLPRWGGESGEGGAYLDAATKLLPQPYRDCMYARCASILFVTAGYESIGPESKMPLGKIFKSMDTLMQTNMARPWEIEYMLKLTMMHDQIGSDRAVRLIRYHIEHFPMPTKYFYDLPENIQDKYKQVLKEVFKP